MHRAKVSPSYCALERKETYDDAKIEDAKLKEIDGILIAASN